MSAKARPARPITQVYFHWSCDGVKPDEQVRVVGSTAELGNWQPSMGVAMTPSEHDDTCFTTPAVPLPLGKQISYKYVIEPKVGDLRWEVSEGNRLVVPTGRRHVLEDDGGKARKLVVASWGQGIAGDSAPVRPGSPEIQPTEAAMTAVPMLQMPKIESFQRRLKLDEELQVTSNDDVLVVFRSLPFKLERRDNCWHVASAETLTFKVVSFMQQCSKEDGGQYSMKFVGDPGVRTNDPEERRQITEALAPYSCIPVFVDEHVAEQHLEFCHLFLWPVMHNMKVFDDETALTEGQEAPTKFDEAQWKNYQVWNRTYAEVVETHLEDNKTLIWLHDFYLLLFPRFLSIRRPDAKMGFFLHSAFPNSEVLRCIPNREEVLQSMLSCKVVTFQTFEYARNFLSCCQLVLNCTYRFRGAGEIYIDYEGKSVGVRADHFVLPYARFVERLDNKEIEKLAQDTRQQLGTNRTLFVSIDGDEPFSGMILKLRAFQRFLQECPGSASGVALLQHVLVRQVSSGESENVRELRRLAAETNKQFGRPGQPPVVQIGVGDLSVDERLGLLQGADVFLDTSINDGLNLHPFVFCCAHAKDLKGAMIVSEFSGCSSVLTGCTKVNPWDTQAVMNAMHTAVIMDPIERSKRFKQDHSYISSQSLSQWVSQNLSELKRASAITDGAPVRGLGAGSQLLFMERGFRPLIFESILSDYKDSKKRAIFLDYEGTLAPDNRSVLRALGAQGQLTQGRPLDPDVLESLKSITNDACNTVVVLSGRERRILDKWFGDVDGLGLCAEHGFYSVLPRTLKKGVGNEPLSSDRWQSMTAKTDEDDDWRTIVFELMKQYTKRVQGSVVEYKGSAITWNYRNVGAMMLAKEVALELTRFLDPNGGADSLMHGYNVAVVNGTGYVEVKRKDVDKGVAVNRILQMLGDIDFVLCIGDDRSDEDMFEVVNSLSAQGDDQSSVAFSPKVKRKNVSMTFEEFNPAEHESRSRFYTVTVGRKISKACYFVKDSGQVSELLQKLASQAIVTRLSRFSSMPTLCRGGENLADDGCDSY